MASINNLRQQNEVSKSILYVMNVDWDWPKQRPHFLAEGLSQSNKVLVAYPFSWRRGKLVINSRKKVKLIPFFRFPFGGRSSAIAAVNTLLWKLFFFLVLRLNKFDYIWISSPEMFRAIPRGVAPKVIYDCMDDFLEFEMNKYHYLERLALEKKLIKASAHIFCSSRKLKEVLVERGAQRDQCTIVYNAFDASSFSPNKGLKFIKPTNCIAVGYIGTISSWLDFDAIVSAAQEVPSLNFYIVGPIELDHKFLPKHERIFFLGPMQHENIKIFSDQCDILIMPFINNELVLSVDPVKLYEYIYFDKPILSIYYAGLDRFVGFVDFYKDKYELILKLKNYCSNKTHKRHYSSEDREIFLKSNSWACRLNSINATLSIL